MRKGNDDTPYWTPYTNLGDKLWTSYTNLSDNLWTPYTDLGDNRHENFEEKVENEDENKIFHNFHPVYCNPEIVFYIIYVEIIFHLTVPLTYSVSDA